MEYPLWRALGQNIWRAIWIVAKSVMMTKKDLFHTIELRGECRVVIALRARAGACCPSMSALRLSFRPFYVQTYLTEREGQAVPMMLGALVPAILEVRSMP
jgi:hypothetical protein